MKYLKLKSLNIIFFTVTSLILTIAGCSDMVTSPNNTQVGNNNMTVSIKSDNGVLNNPNDVITIDDAKALVKEVEFEKEGSAENEEISAGPFVIHFNIDGSIQTLSAAAIASGNFTKIKFQIHKPEDNETPPDPEFKEGSSGNQRFSFIIKGKINGNPFVFKSRQSANIVIDLDNIINVQTTAKNVTILFNHSLWFLSNGIIIDPRDPNHENEIDDNLKTSFKKAFEDDDKNGVPDGGH